MKSCLFFVLIGSLCLIGDCAEEKPAIVSIARFLFKVGRQFVPPCRPESPAPKPAPGANLEEPDFDDEGEEAEEKQGLALFEPSPAPEVKPSAKSDDKVTPASDVEVETTTDALTEAP